MDAFYKGMELAKMQHIAIGKEVHTSLDMGHVISAGPCLYAVIQDVISIYHLFFSFILPSSFNGIDRSLREHQTQSFTAILTVFSFWDNSY